jgi:predicted GIY-YIG superfamily endonuclease
MHFVYIVRCADDSLYVGLTTDLDNRLRVHDEGRCGAYTKDRRPVTLVYFERHDSFEAAFARESQLKGWTRQKKEALIAGNLKALKRFSRCRNP